MSKRATGGSVWVTRLGGWVTRVAEWVIRSCKWAIRGRKWVIRPKDFNCSVSVLSSMHLSNKKGLKLTTLV